MKRILLSLVVLVISQAVFAQKNRAKVQKVNGVEVYVMNEPLREYDVVSDESDFLSTIEWGSIATSGLINESASAKVGKMVKGIVKVARKKDIDFDAIIYSNGKTAAAIKFTEEATEENEGIAETGKIAGIPFYVMCEPLMDYVVTADKSGGVKWQSAGTYGLVNKTVEEDVTAFVERFKRLVRKEKVEAVIYTSGKKASGVKFK